MDVWTTLYVELISGTGSIMGWRGIECWVWPIARRANRQPTTWISNVILIYHNLTRNCLLFHFNLQLRDSQGKAKEIIIKNFPPFLLEELPVSTWIYRYLYPPWTPSSAANQRQTPFPLLFFSFPPSRPPCWTHSNAMRSRSSTECLRNSRIIFK